MAERETGTVQRVTAAGQWWIGPERGGAEVPVDGAALDGLGQGTLRAGRQVTYLTRDGLAVDLRLEEADAATVNPLSDRQTGTVKPLSAGDKKVEVIK